MFTKNDKQVLLWSSLILVVFALLFTPGEYWMPELLVPEFIRNDTLPILLIQENIAWILGLFSAIVIIFALNRIYRSFNY